MDFITDTEAKEIAKRIFSPEEYDDFVKTTELMRHFQDCVAEGKPSLHCKDTDPAENLRWCHVALRLWELHFEDYLQRILAPFVQ